MKPIVLNIVAIATLAVAGPALAQSSNRSSDVDYSDWIDQLQSKLQNDIQNNAINSDEAVSLRRQVRALSRLEQQYRYNGYSNTERADLDDQIHDLRQQIRAADRGRTPENDNVARDDRRDDRYSDQPATKPSVGNMLDNMLGKPPR